MANHNNGKRVRVEHWDRDCTGEWRLEHWGAQEYFRCHTCGAVAYYSDAAMAAVCREMEMGALLASLSRRRK